MQIMKTLGKLSTVLILIFWAGQGFAQNENVNYKKIWERFSENDPNSTVRINHKPLSDYLEATVFPVGRSYRVLGE